MDERAAFEASAESLLIAAAVLDNYATVVRNCKVDEIERFDYLPQIEDAAETVRQAARAAAPATERAELSPLTAADEAVLRKANLDLAMESCRLQKALAFYAEGQHMLDMDRWESVSGESECWLAPPYKCEESWMVEDGLTAKLALAPFNIAAAPAQAEQQAQVRWLPASMTAEQVRAHPLYKVGDMRLVWVLEQDFWKVSARNVEPGVPAAEEGAEQDKNQN